jgi:hypothetical protein
VVAYYDFDVLRVGDGSAAEVGRKIVCFCSTLSCVDVPSQSDMGGRTVYVMPDYVK